VQASRIGASAGTSAREERNKMKVGDLVKYTYNDGRGTNEQMGLVTAVDGDTIWWVDTDARESWTHRLNLEVISESR
jgi:hypothetical protein